MTIDGFTQAGASANTLTNGNDAVYQIVLDGTGAGVGSDGLQLGIGSDQSTIRGLVIQNFSGDGIEINSSSLNTIEGNFIGTTLDGSTAAPNGGNGVFIYAVNEAADQNIVGGSTPDARNLISGNGVNGVHILAFTGPTADGNRVANNYIGTDAAGTAALGNGSNGVFIENTSFNRIGTTGGAVFPGAPNLISGNGNDGILIRGVALDGRAANGNEVRSNLIGTDVSGAAPLGNALHGVEVSFDANDNSIGGAPAIAGVGNTIRFNAGDGVAVTGTPGVVPLGTMIMTNAIDDNGGLGIDLGDDGPTLNDPLDPDLGPNNFQNFPLLTSAVSTATDLTITGTLNSLPNQQFIVQFFSSPAADPTAFGEGRTFLFETTVTTDAAGNAAFNVSSPTPIAAFLAVTSTASLVIPPNGNVGRIETSEFSELILSGLSGIDLAITKADTPDPVLVGQNLTYTLTVTNNSLSDATNVVVTDTLPANVAFVSATPSQGTASEAAGIVTANLGTLTAGASATITIVVTPTAAAGGTTITNTANVGASEEDTDDTNNTATARTDVLAAVDLAIAKADAPDPVLVGQNLTYTLTVTNNGPNDATGVVVTDILPANVLFVSATPSQGTASEAAGIVTANLGNLAAGASATVTIVVTPTSTNGGTRATITNTAVVVVNETDTDPANNTVTVTTEVVRPPVVTDLDRLGVHHQPTVLVVTFSDPMDVGPATNVANYSLIVSSGPHAVGREIDIVDAVISADGLSVQLYPAIRLPIHGFRYQLTINGMPEDGLASDGVLLDGNDDTLPSGNYVSDFGREILVLPTPIHTPRPTPMPTTPRPHVPSWFPHELLSVGSVAELDQWLADRGHSDRVAFRNYVINLLKLSTEPIGSAVEVQAAARTIAPSARSPLPAWVPTSFRSVESLAALDAELERLGQTSRGRFRAFLADTLDLN